MAWNMTTSPDVRTRAALEKLHAAPLYPLSTIYSALTLCNLLSMRRTTVDATA